MPSAERRTRQAGRRRAEDVVSAINGDANCETIRIPPDAHTLEGFRRWAMSDGFPRRGRISFIGGEVIIDMSPEELSTHNYLKFEVGGVARNVIVEDNLGQGLADRAWITNAKADLSTEPDLGFASWESFRNGRVRMVEREDQRGRYLELQGSVDWVLEIVSRHSVEKDTKVLRRKYHLAQINEYWLIDARGRKVNFQILWHEPKAYVQAPNRDGWMWSRVFKRFFKLERTKNEFGFWTYRLQVRRK